MEPSTELGGTVFPPEVMMEILSRVPTKPLTSFKMVNHAWESLIRDKYFISKMHLPQMKEQNFAAYMFQAQYDLYPLAYRPGGPNSTNNHRMISHFDPEVLLVASCNGLVLRCNAADEYHLLNPTTGKRFVIPHSKIIFPTGSTFASVVFGMGYVEDEDVFKIVRICCFNNKSSDTSVSLLSTRSMEWTDLGPFPYPSPIEGPGVFAGGCINWQAKAGNRTTCIATFNVRTQLFGHIELPREVESVDCYGELGAIDDDRLVLYSRVCITFRGFEMWVFDQHGHSETWLRMRFPEGGVVNVEERALGIQPIRLMKPCDMCILFHINPLDLYFIYNMELGTYEQLHAPLPYEDYCTVFPFIESLVDPRFLVD